MTYFSVNDYQKYKAHGLMEGCCPSIDLFDDLPMTTMAQDQAIRAIALVLGFPYPESECVWISIIERETQIERQRLGDVLDFMVDHFLAILVMKGAGIDKPTSSGVPTKFYKLTILGSAATRRAKGASFHDLIVGPAPKPKRATGEERAKLDREIKQADYLSFMRSTGIDAEPNETPVPEMDF